MKHGDRYANAKSLRAPSPCTLSVHLGTPLRSREIDYASCRRSAVCTHGSSSPMLAIKRPPHFPLPQPSDPAAPQSLRHYRETVTRLNSVKRINVAKIRTAKAGHESFVDSSGRRRKHRVTAYKSAVFTGGLQL